MNGKSRRKYLPNICSTTCASCFMLFFGVTIKSNYCTRLSSKVIIQDQIQIIAKRPIRDFSKIINLKTVIFSCTGFTTVIHTCNRVCTIYFLIMKRIIFRMIFRVRMENSQNFSKVRREDLPYKAYVPKMAEKHTI